MDIQLGFSSCSLNKLSLDGINDGLMQLTNVYTEPENRNKGYAKALLTHICAKADYEQFAILLEPKSNEDIETSSLVKFYAKHGFERLQKEPLLMVRYPKEVAKEVKANPLPYLVNKSISA